MKNRMPVAFIGHGSPMNALENNKFTKSWKSLAKKIPKPKAIVAISAHWVNDGTCVTAMQMPKMIYDFYGFPKELSQVKYAAPGSPFLAKRIEQILAARSDSSWGLDHGAWSVLVHMYPKADVPVVQLSIKQDISLEEAFELGKKLSVLRDESVLILGLGNIVHNLGMMSASKPYAWAIEFEEYVRKVITSKNVLDIIHAVDHPSFSKAHPSIEHFLPLVYICGAAGRDRAEVFNEGVTLGAISMMSVVWASKTI